ncbi:Ribosomal large subunit pseudouridine synthase C,23S rRNA pseudouridylate synthase C,pseudouridine synthase, RluA family,RNA pseudouridylate synthase [Chlamydia serpentis]|uniref:Ribosomal large subunit pseudouridine synthase C,23S rRNA pseudouridylate synthase C,pseudouridine synthase, RluA family,RNA pseudouridylate synthase n=1 Tax=Chlamydia serpentis TaxID=1967782 RepID=A0A2R8FAT3_9CHLA|nr:RluA family pseudouridine synthase [Chlamydia serpentis]SPN73538.1 Ribosomal large subunit pseudouridine synthase C,23S rRNA pseudouridylate synthase C,pseudouridine synthase, RluA family,RNA pseudouridylate synthase [Chlamydia serpentis]
MEKFSWLITEVSRLSSFLRSQLPNHSKKNILSAIREHRCQVNGFVERFESYKIQPGDHVTLSLVTSIQEKLSILWEDDSIIIYDKPPHMTTEQISQATGLFTVHRLDKGTSGCLLMGKSKQAAMELMKLFKQRKIYKQYTALVFGHPKKKSGVIRSYTAPVYRRCGAVIFGSTPPSQGKLTITEWLVMQSYKQYTLMLCKPITGRTHQIRLQMQLLGCPIVGDVDYGPKKQPPRVFRPLLHAQSLEFISPFSNLLLKVSASTTEDPRECARHLLHN